MTLFLLHKILSDDRPATIKVEKPNTVYTRSNGSQQFSSIVGGFISLPIYV